MIIINPATITLKKLAETSQALPVEIDMQWLEDVVFPSCPDQARLLVQDAFLLFRCGRQESHADDHECLLRVPDGLLSLTWPDEEEL